jgi:hypothetical protein
VSWCSSGAAAVSELVVVVQSWSASRVAQSRVYSEAAGESSELQSCKENGSCSIGRQATSEDTV